MKSLLFHFLLFISAMSGITVLNAQQPIKPGTRGASQNSGVPQNQKLKGDSNIVNVGAATIYKSYPEWLPVKVMPNYNGTKGPAHSVPGKAVPLNRWFSPLFWWKVDLDYDDYPKDTIKKAIPLWSMPLFSQVSPWGLMLTHQQEFEPDCDQPPLLPYCNWTNSPNPNAPMSCASIEQIQSFRTPRSNYNCWTISVESLLVDKSRNPFFVKPVDFGDWDVQMNWNDGQRSLTLSSLAGSPMVYGEVSGGELELQLPTGDVGTGVNVDGDTIGPRGVSFYNSEGTFIGRSADYGAGTNPEPPKFDSVVKDGVIGLQFITIKSTPDGQPEKGDTIYYACFVPQGTTWNFIQGTNKNILPTRGGYLTKLISTNRKGSTFHFTVALLPSLADKTKFPLEALKAFRDAAGYHVSKTIFTWDAWDAANSSITAHYTFEVKDVTKEIPSSNPSVVTSIFKPHQKLMGDKAPYLKEGNRPYDFFSPRGPLKVIRLPLNQTRTSAQYDVTYPYYGYVPALPDPELQGDDLSNLQNFISADSRQTSANSSDFFSQSVPDAYSMGANLYYKAMQLGFGLQQYQGLKGGIPDWRGKGATVPRDTAIRDIVGFMKADIEDFFTARRDSSLAYQWRYINAKGNDVYGFKSVQPPQNPPEVFQCMNDTTGGCNPNEPLTRDLQTGRYWLLDSLNNIQKTKKNPYLVLRNADFTVNKFLKTAPGIGLNMYIAWMKFLKEGSSLASPPLYVFFAPSRNQANPDSIRQWTQCVFNHNDTTFKNGLYLASSVGIGGGDGFPNDTAMQQWHLKLFPYNGSVDYYPHRVPADTCDILIVLDCAADCQNFPATCNDTIKPVYSDDIKFILGPVNFGGKDRRFIAYDPAWNTMLGNKSWYGSTENMADHHFGWGYIIKAAAFVAQFGDDPNWASQGKWGGLVNLLIRDVMDWRKPGSSPGQYNFVRNKYLNPVEGHMYADGCGAGGIGNNEESSSESINFSEACIEWGTATGQTDIRDLGILLRSMYTQAVPMYWFNVDGDVLPSTSADKSFPIAGRIWGGGNDHDTFFSGGGSGSDEGCYSRNSDVVAIQTLPLQAGTMRLSTLKYNSGLNAKQSPLQQAWKTLENAGGPYCSQGKCYLSSLLGFQSLFDPGKALVNFKKNTQGTDLKNWYNYNPQTGGLRTPNDHSYAATFSFINSMKKLGPATETPLSSKESNPFYMPLADGSFLVYNYTKKERRFTIGGKQTPSVPPLRCIQVK